MKIRLVGEAIIWVSRLELLSRTKIKAKAFEVFFFYSACYDCNFNSWVIHPDQPSPEAPADTEIVEFAMSHAGTYESKLGWNLHYSQTTLQACQLALERVGSHVTNAATCSSSIKCYPTDIPHYISSFLTNNFPLPYFHFLYTSILFALKRTCVLLQPSKLPSAVFATPSSQLPQSPPLCLIRIGMSRQEGSRRLRDRGRSLRAKICSLRIDSHTAPSLSIQQRPTNQVSDWQIKWWSKKCARTRT